MNELKKKEHFNNIILGVDPGTNITGFGIIEIIQNKPKLITIHELFLGKIENHYKRLEKIHFKVIELISNFKCNEMAIEMPFLGKNTQSMLKLGRAQGTIIGAALSMGLNIFEYTPKKIKLSITGNGNASKEQVAQMLKHLIALKVIPKNLDSTDGLAVAFCHFLNNKSIQNKVIDKKKYSSWSSFISENKSKLV